MSTPISFTIRPPTNGSSSSSSDTDQNRTPTAAPFRIPTAPIRPSPLSTSSYTRRSEQDRPRRSAFGGDDDDEDDADHGRQGAGRGKGKGKDEAIVGFNEDGLETSNKTRPAGPMVIPSLPNRDWRQSSHSKSAKSRKPTYMPEGGPRVITADDLVERSGDDVIQGGLQRVESTTANEEDQANGVATPTSTGPPTDSLSTETETLSLEQQALRAVLESGNENSSSSRDMTIDLQTDTLNLFDRPQGPGDETDAFRQDILTRPEESTMEDYSSVPIESFGAALLRGMGWNPGSGPNPKVHEPKRRPAGLGLGASEKPGSESGKAGQGKGSTEGMSRGERDRKRKEDYATRGGRGYIPVVKRARESHIDASTSTSTSRAGSPGSGSSVARVGSRQGSRSVSPPRSDTSRSRRRDGDRETHGFDQDRNRDRNGDRDSGRRGEYSTSTRDRERERERDYDSGSRRRDDDRYRSSRRDDGERGGSRYDSDRDRERERGGGDRDRERDRYREKERDRGGRDRRSDRDRDGDYDRRR